MLLVDARYNRSCQSFGTKLLILLLSVAVLVLKCVLFITDTLPARQSISTFLYDTIFDISATYTWLPLLIIPILIIAVRLINILSSVSALFHDFVSGVATIFIADLLLKAASQNPVLTDSSNLFSAQYIAVSLCIFALISISLFATSYPTVNSIFVSVRQKKFANPLERVGEDIRNNKNTNEVNRQEYFEMSKKVSGRLVTSITAIIITVMSLIATVAWLSILSVAGEQLYNLTLLILVILPSCINLIEIGNRPNAEKNIFKELINCGKDFMPKPSGLNLIGKQIKNIFLPASFLKK